MADNELARRWGGGWYFCVCRTALLLMAVDLMDGTFYNAISIVGRRIWDNNMQGVQCYCISLLHGQTKIICGQ